MVAALVLIPLGCNDDRIAKLEKENKELRSAQSDRDRVADYDLQEKCAKDGRAWFNENWSRDKSTLLLDYHNHYSKRLNKCFIEVEYHYGSGGSDWTSNITIYDIYENGEYAQFSQNHFYLGSDTKDRGAVMHCEVSGKTCTTLDQFNSLSGEYMSN
jgi:alpha-mannosidase